MLFFILRYKIDLIIQKSWKWLILHLNLMRFDHFKMKTHVSGQYLVILITVSQSSWINLTGSFWDSHNFSFYDELYVTLKTLYDFYEPDLAKQKFTTIFFIFIIVHIFWKGHQILRNFHLTFDWHYVGQK